jgi:hypothetical protein
MARKSELHIFAPDLHFPSHDKATWRALMNFIGRNKISTFIFGGDQFDNAEISGHNIGKSIYKPEGAFKKNEIAFDKQILRPLERELRGAAKGWLVGNHDEWESEASEVQPELKGCLNRITNLRLRERGWKIISNGKSTQIGKLVVCHGNTISGGSNLATRKAIEIYFKSTLFGHFHSASSSSKVSPVDSSQKYMAWSSPALCNLNPAYMRDKPNAWIHGFTIIETLPNGNFNVYPIVVTRGRFAFGGVIYAA